MLAKELVWLLCTAAAAAAAASRWRFLSPVVVEAFPLVGGGGGRRTMHHAAATTARAATTTTPATVVGVTGATGKVGRQVVQQLLERSNVDRIKCLVRNMPAAPPDTRKVEWIVGNVTHYDSVVPFVTNCTALICVHGISGPPQPWYKTFVPALFPPTSPQHPYMVNYKALQYLIQAWRQTSSSPQKSRYRMVRLTGKGESPWSLASILLNALGAMTKAWNYEGEQWLRQQEDVDYTIIRPGLLDDSLPPQSHLQVADNGQELPTTRVAPHDIANLCVSSCLDHSHTTSRATLTVGAAAANGDDDGRPCLLLLLQDVKPDSRTFPNDMMARHVRATRTGVAVGTILLSLVAYKTSQMGWAILRLLWQWLLCR